MLRLHDTATGTVRPLELRDESEVTMYVCGPTVYGVPHLGHGRMSLVFDVLRRYLEFIGKRVTFVSNITDVDDKIIARANAETRSEEDVATEFEKAWWDAMDQLGVKRPDEIPHATAWIEAMVGVISELIERGAAYETDDGVYLSVEKVPGYGLLAHQSLESLRSGARVEVDEKKRSPVDFALWKRAKPGEPTWASPFGDGRPGWHTECVAMSLGLLGEGFDIHGGGLDLAFPHHENERAQAVALGRDFARHWVHNGFVEMDDEKMSKSLGNFVSLPDMFEESDWRAYRLLVLRAHYRSPIDVTRATVADAEAALVRLDNLARRFDLDASLGSLNERDALEAGVDVDALAFFNARMQDDLDTPNALGHIFELSKRANGSADGGDHDTAQRLSRTVAILAGALGLELHSRSGDGPDEAVLRMASERVAARAGGDFKKADELRDEILAAGWIIEDGSGGPRFRPA
ncbi:MAG: cysteine--tRNA ligase [Acidimicrobiales bacterium]